MTAMPRPTAKLTDDQREMLAALVAQAKKFRDERQRTQATEELAWQMLIRLRQEGVADELLCEQTGFSRATLNRRFGTRTNLPHAGADPGE